jgi:hypothetical protein
MTKVALKWTPEGKIKRGRPKTKWRPTIENEIKERGHTWGTIERKAKCGIFELFCQFGILNYSDSVVF